MLYCPTVPKLQMPGEFRDSKARSRMCRIKEQIRIGGSFSLLF